MIEKKKIPLDQIRIDGGTQSRVAINDAVVSDYAYTLGEGGDLPAIVLFFDGSDYWLADGFHRFRAHEKIGALSIDAQVLNGTKRDAILFSAGANAEHGLRRTNEDKRRAVSILLADEEWSKWSDREISRRCGVGAPFVGDVRRSICVPNTDASTCNPITDRTRTVVRNGTTYEQSTANIGKVKSIATPDVEVELDSLSVASPAVIEPKLVALPAPAASESDVAVDEDDTPDFLLLLRKEEEKNAGLTAQVEALNKKIELLMQDDMAAAIADWSYRYDQLNSHLETRTGEYYTANNERIRYSGLLKKLRKAANVETNSELLAQITPRVEAHHG